MLLKTPGIDKAKGAAMPDHTSIDAKAVVFEF